MSSMDFIILVNHKDVNVTIIITSFHVLVALPLLREVIGLVV